MDVQSRKSAEEKMKKSPHFFSVCFFLLCMAIEFLFCAFAVPDLRGVCHFEKRMEEETFSRVDFPVPDTEKRNSLRSTLSGSPISEKREKKFSFELFLSSHAGENKYFPFSGILQENELLPAGFLFQELLCSVFPERAGPGKCV